MSKIEMDSLVDIIFNLRWKSDAALHTDCYQASKVNVWRDFFPPSLLDSLLGKEPGERLELKIKSGDYLPDYQENRLVKVSKSQFSNRTGQEITINPQLGRFYPKGLLEGISGIYRENIQPFRCVGINNGNLSVDFNHPIAGKELTLSCLIGKVETKTVERGGTSIDWIEMITDGPGMQARWQNQKTDYLNAHSFDRQDERPDAKFYESPRFVQHIDDTAIEMVRNTYGRFLTSGMDVLDLMSSWQSHVPQNLDLKRLSGLGMNKEELKRNKQLNDFTVQDINQSKMLPYRDKSFDAVLNTVSIEYLTDPDTAFNEIARILRPGGYFIVTFSNRWFPPKVIKVWEELHEFERMGLVIEYFIRSGSFSNLQTYSIRGLPRPHTDKYYPKLRFSDPIFAVWGQKI